MGAGRAVAESWTHAPVTFEGDEDADSCSEAAWSPIRRARVGGRHHVARWWQALLRCCASPVVNTITDALRLAVS